MPTKLLISYGSTMNTRLMRYRCPKAKVIAKSWLHDYRLVFKGIKYAHATVIPEPEQSVPILLWEITPEDEASLDKFEGVSQGFYNKEYRTVECDGELKEALIYIMAPNILGVPDDLYLGVIAEAYKALNFPVCFLNEALKYSTENKGKEKKKDAV